MPGCRLGLVIYSTTVGSRLGFDIVLGYRLGPVIVNDFNVAWEALGTIRYYMLLSSFIHLFLSGPTWHMTMTPGLLPP